MMQRPPNEDAELLQAEATIVVLRGLANKDVLSLPDRYQVLPGTAVVGRESVRVLLAQMPKPLVCTSFADESALRIDCKSFEDFFSIPASRFRNWETTRSDIAEELKQWLKSLSPADIEAWSVSVASGDAKAVLTVSDYLKWESGYTFQGCTVTRERDLDVDEAHPRLVVRFENSRGNSPDLTFLVDPKFK